MFVGKDFQFDIIDGIQIDDLLIQNPDIVKNNIKLWVTPYYLENIYKSKLISLGTEIMLNEVENNLKYFVETKSFYEAQEILLDNNCIVIIGQPGVGKTTISNELLKTHNEFRLVEETDIIREVLRGYESYLTKIGKLHTEI